MAWLEKTISGRYRVRDRDASGKTFTAIKDAGIYRATAEEIRKKYEDQQSRQAAGISTPGRLISEAATLWLNSKPLAPKTLNKYKTDLARFSRHMAVTALGDLSAEKLEAWAAGMRSGEYTYSRGGPQIRYNEHGINSAMSSVRVFCRFCVARGWIPEQVLKGATVHRVPSPRRFLKRQDILTFIRSCRKPLRKLILFGLYTGMRSSEVLAAQWEHIEGGVLRIPKAKRHLQRSVPLHPRLLSILRPKKKRGGIFPGWSKNRLSTARRRAMARAGMGRVRFHDLRHSFIRNFLVSGAGDIAQLRGITGHQSLASLQTYAHFDSADLTSAMKRVRIS